MRVLVVGAGATDDREVGLGLRLVVEGDRLLALAKKEAHSTHRSATAEIEHWATLGRAVEVHPRRGRTAVSDPERPGAVTMQATGVPAAEPTAPRRVAARRKAARRRA